MEYSSSNFQKSKEKNINNLITYSRFHNCLISIIIFMSKKILLLKIGIFKN